MLSSKADMYRWSTDRGYSLTVLTCNEEKNWGTFGEDATMTVMADLGRWTVGGVELLGKGRSLRALEVSGGAEIIGSGTLGFVTSDKTLAGLPKVTQRISRCEVIKYNKPWGFELSPVTKHELHLLKILVADQRHRTSEQYHEEKDEVIFPLLVSTDAVMQKDDTKFLPEPYKFYHIRAGEVHRVTGFMRYFEGSTYHPKDVVRVSDDYGR